MSTLDLQVIRFLGEGTSGKVFLVKDQLSRTKVALKVVPKEGKNEYGLAAVLKERKIAEKLSDSPWFVELWAAWADQRNLYIAMTVYPTDLESEMLRCGIIEPERARFYMAEIIIALTELHSRGIIHRDVKAPNILIGCEGHIALADFGLSKDFGEQPTIAERVFQPYWPYLRTDSPTSETPPRDPEELFFVTWDYRGSELEMAPEVHLRKPHSFGIDFWSAAVVLYWMLTGRPPFYIDEDEVQFVGEEQSGVKTLAQQIAKDPLYWDPADNVDSDTKDFLERMMEKDPGKRLTISYEMLNHPYFHKINWDLMEQRRVPPPWIPPHSVCHIHEPTSPSFTPGEPFTIDSPDPFPEFNFISQRLAEQFASKGSNQDLIYYGEEWHDDWSDFLEDDERSDATDLTDLEAIHYEDFPFVPPSSPSERTLKSDSFNNDFLLKEAYDISITNSPSGQEHQSVPKRRWSTEHWAASQAVTDRVALEPPAPPGLGKAFSIPCVPLEPDLAADGGPRNVYPTPLVPHRHRQQPSECSSTTSSIGPSSSTPQRTRHVVNGTGVLFKMKVWMSRLWPPKPREIQQLNRLSLLA